MEEFNYDKKQYFMHITLNSIICLLLLLGLLYLTFISTGSLRGLFIFFSIVSAYSVWNTFISFSNPEKVILSEDSISFSAYGHVHEYKLCDIKSFRVKEFKMANKQFITINGGKLFKGRYWVHCYEFENGKDLYKKIVGIELKIHPKSLKAIAYNNYQA